MNSNQIVDVDALININKNINHMFTLKQISYFFQPYYFNYLASPEIKGIRGSDQKKFLLDLMRLSPRDANWVSNDLEYLCCVIRPELISHYITYKNFTLAS